MRGLLAVAAIAFTPIAFHAAVWWWPNAPTPAGRPVAAATLFEDRNGIELALLATRDGAMHLPVTAGETGRWLGNAVVAIEDHRFAEHNGVDWHAAAAAAWDDLLHLRFRRGASTIPMQVIRLRDPAPRSLAGKAFQAVRATQLMRVASRDAVLLEYLNRAPFGGNLVGVGAASRHYFSKTCDRLTLAEAATLAGLPQNPDGLRPDRFPDRALARRNLVLDRMSACGTITAEQHAATLAEPLTLRVRPLPQNEALALLPTLARVAGHSGGGVLHTTFDADLQRTAATLLSRHLATLPAGPVKLSAAAVILDTASGDCLAAVSCGPSAGALDLTACRRSTGSVLKPFIYATAFADGVCGPGTLVDDAPRTWAGYTPRNMDRTFGGRLTAGQALAQSRNLPAMAVLSRVGVGRVAGVLRGLGVRMADADQVGLTLAVGGVEASPMEVAGAFATLGRGGAWRPVKLWSPLPVGRGRVREGVREMAEPLDTRQTPSLTLPREYTGEGTTFVLPVVACAQTLRALADENRTVAVRPDARRLAPAWKTGTSSGQRDAWCAAVTADRTVVVWIGDSASQGDSALVGIEAAAPVAFGLLLAASPGDGRPAPVAPPVVATDVVSLAAPAARLTIVSPTAGQDVILDPTVPASGQRLRLRTTGGRVFWFVDAEPLASADGDVWWSPMPGSHVLRAVAASGEVATVRVKVATPGG